jgi:hypothetical protein
MNHRLIDFMAILEIELADQGQEEEDQQDHAQEMIVQPPSVWPSSCALGGIDFGAGLVGWLDDSKLLDAGARYPGVPTSKLGLG